MKIVVKLPKELRDVVATFPMLQVLNKYFVDKLEAEENEEIFQLHLIGYFKTIDVLNLLPFQAFYHEVNDDDLDNIFGMHRACVNMRLDSPDYFISTTTGFVDASAGKHLGAKEKIGFVLGQNKWFLTKKIELIQGQHKSKEYFQLLKGLVEPLPPIPNVTGRKVDPIFADWSFNKYTVIDLPLQDEEIDSEWEDFFDLCVNKNFILMCTAVSYNEQAEILENFIKKLPGKNTYKKFEYLSNIDFAKLITYAECFVTYDSPLLQIASYCGVYTFYIHEKSIKDYAPIFYYGEVNYMDRSEATFQDGDGLAYGKVFDQVYAFIDDSPVPQDDEVQVVDDKK